MGMLASSMGRGDITILEQYSGMHRNTISAGKKEWESGERHFWGSKIRDEGGGRKQCENKVNQHLAEMDQEEIVEKICNIVGRQLEDNEEDSIFGAFDGDDGVKGEIANESRNALGGEPGSGVRVGLGSEGGPRVEFNRDAEGKVIVDPTLKLPHSRILFFPEGAGVHVYTRKQEKAMAKDASKISIVFPENVMQKMKRSGELTLTCEPGSHIMFPANVRVILPAGKTTTPVKKTEAGSRTSHTPRKHLVLLPLRIQVKLYGVESLPRKRLLLSSASLDVMRRCRKKLSLWKRRHLSELRAMEDEYYDLVVTGQLKKYKSFSPRSVYIPGANRNVKYTGLFIVTGWVVDFCKVKDAALEETGEKGDAADRRKRREARRKWIKEYTSYTNNNLFPPNFNFHSIRDIIELIVINDICGDPMTGRKYTRLTALQFREFIRDLTVDVPAPTTILSLLKKWGISLHASKKLEQVGERHPQTDEQMDRIEFITRYFRARGWTILSIDARAKVRLGACATQGREWTLDGIGRECPDHDWAVTYGDIYVNGSPPVPKELMNEKAECTPFGVYCVNDCSSYVSTGLTHDTAAFAGKALTGWWDHTAPERRKKAPILILSDSGGSNRARGVEWKNEISKFADYTGCPVCVCHFPRGKSKYNYIERHLWGIVSRMWAARPKNDLETVREYFQKLNDFGFNCTCEIDSTVCKTQAERKIDYRAAKLRGEKVRLSDYIISSKQFYKSTYVEFPVHNSNVEEDAMPEWNYFICPHDPEPEAKAESKTTQLSNKRDLRNSRPYQRETWHSWGRVCQVFLGSKPAS